MCKRTVEAHEDLKRQRLQQYTQGPLDQTFGQHRVFPVEDTDLPVWAYLAEVRKEAENDRVCHYIKKPEINNVTKIVTGELDDASDDILRTISQEYIATVMSRLENEKRKYREEHLTSDAGEIQLSVNDIDFTIPSDEALKEAVEDQGGAEDEVGEVAQEDDFAHIEDEDENIDQTSNDVIQETESMLESFSRPAGNDVDIETSESTSNREFVPKSAAKWREYVFGSPPPPLSYFYDILDHPTVIKLVVYYTKWLLATMPPMVGEWIFFTFVRLDNGLDYRELAIVRDLGKKAHKLRLKLVAAKVSHNPIYDMILAIVGDYFGQKDLLE